MNERIKELYELSFITDDYVNVGINGVELGIRFDPEKFAELIVKECIQIKDELSQFDGTTPFGDGYEEGLKDMAESIKEHFGVE